jgi:hypothetical protein
MDNTFLTARGMAGVSLVDSEKHWRSRAKIEGNEFPDIMITATGDVNFIHATSLNFGVSDQLRIASRHYGIGVQTTFFQNARQVFNMRDVIDDNVFRISRHGMRLMLRLGPVGV